MSDHVQPMGVPEPIDVDEPRHASSPGCPTCGHILVDNLCSWSGLDPTNCLGDNPEGIPTPFVTGQPDRFPVSHSNMTPEDQDRLAMEQDEGMFSDLPHEGVCHDCQLSEVDCDCAGMEQDEPLLDIYEEAISALLKIMNHDAITDSQSAQILDQMVSPLRAIRRRNQFLPLQGTEEITIDEAIRRIECQ